MWKLKNIIRLEYLVENADIERAWEVLDSI